MTASGRGSDFLLTRAKKFLEGIPERAFSVRLWDGSLIDPTGSNTMSRFTLCLNHPAGAASLLARSSVQTIAEAFIGGLVEVEGDLMAAMRFGETLPPIAGTGGRLLSALAGLRARVAVATKPNTARARLSGKRGSEKRAQAAIDYHYSYPLEFWRQWLDPSLQYTCAYFLSPEESLEVAQRRKLDYICRKLRLKPGVRLLDLGCGWGGLMLYAAREFGATVVGVTNNEAQAEYVRALVSRSRMEHQCEVWKGDIRSARLQEDYDRVSGVGIIEHMGTALHKEYFQCAWRALRRGGLFFNQGITRSRTHPIGDGRAFMARYIFPDGELVPIDYTLRCAQECGFELHDVESLRAHYVLTLKAWLRSLEARADKVFVITDAATYRKFRFYLAGCALGFETGQLNVHQTILAKGTAEPDEIGLSRNEVFETPELGSVRQ